MNRMFSGQAVVVNWLTMYVNRIIIRIFTCAFVVALMLFCNSTKAQQLKYSRQNVFIGNPNDLQVVANISGTHHMISFNYDETITIFIFNNNLEFKKKITTPFKFSEKGIVRIIAFADYYYVSLYSHKANKNIFWQVNADGNCIDRTLAFEKLLLTQRQHIESGFELKECQGQLCLMYHTYLPKLEKRVLTMVLADTALNVALTKKVMYELKESGERPLQEQIIADKHLLVLKSTTGGTALKLMKVDIATGLTVSNDFNSSGFYFSQPEFTYHPEDSTIHLSSMLKEPYKAHSRKNYVFIARLDDMLVEKTPFTLLKTQFRKNTGTNFLLLNKQAGWVRLKTGWGARNNYESINWAALSTGDAMTPAVSYGSNVDVALEQLEGVRFSLIDKNLKISSDSLIGNNKNSYTIKPGQFTQFGSGQKEYLIVAEQFFRKRRGLLMISADDYQRLIYTQLPVIDHYDYFLHKAKKLPNQSIIIPYLHKLEAGLIRITGK